LLSCRLDQKDIWRTAKPLIDKHGESPLLASSGHERSRVSLPLFPQQQKFQLPTSVIGGGADVRGAGALIPLLTQNGYLIDFVYPPSATTKNGAQNVGWAKHERSESLISAGRLH
jgi:hypothetical protein